MNGLYFEMIVPGVDWDMSGVEVGFTTAFSGETVGKQWANAGMKFAE